MPVSVPVSCACACVSSAPPALSVLQPEDGACQAAEKRPCGKATQALGGGRDDGDTAISPMLCAVRPYEGHRLQIPGCTTRECWAVSGLRLCGANSMSDPAAMTARQMDTCTHTHSNTHTWTDQDHGKQAGREERRTGHWGQTAGAWLRGGGTCPLSLPPPVVGSFSALSLPSSRWSSLLCVTLALVLASDNGRFYLAPPTESRLLCSLPCNACFAAAVDMEAG